MAPTFPGPRLEPITPEIPGHQPSAWEQGGWREEHGLKSNKKDSIRVWLEAALPRGWVRKRGVLLTLPWAVRCSIHPRCWGTCLCNSVLGMRQGSRGDCVGSAWAGACVE